MNLLNQILLIMALLSIGIVYGTDMFHAIVVKQAATRSSNQGIHNYSNYHGGHSQLIQIPTSTF